MNIKQQIISSSKYSIKCPYHMNPEHIVVHNTANDAPAANEIKYMQSNNNQVSFHFAVDDKEIIQGLPLDRNAWACGDGVNGEGNRKGIQVEICYSKSGGVRFENAEKNGARAELDRLVDKRFIAPQIAELINIRQIEKFFESEFYKLLKNAKKTYREQRFNILLPASHFTQDEEFKTDIDGEKILVQGVIDLFFESENGDVILCDYKTDYLTPEELRDESLIIEKMKARHGKQLEYYAMAIERFLGKRPDKILIYSLPFGEAVEVLKDKKF